MPYAPAAVSLHNRQSLAVDIGAGLVSQRVAPALCVDDARGLMQHLLHGSIHAFGASAALRDVVRSRSLAIRASPALYYLS